MSFSKRRVPKSKTKSKTLSMRKNFFGAKKKKRSIIWKIIFYLLLFLLLFGVVVSFIVYQKYLSDLPKVTELDNLDIGQASIIYDREGNELYRIFRENRTYVGYHQIHENMINAIIAGEDKRFWENPGVDFIGLTRAVLYRVSGKRESLGGTSTLTQQLIRNTIIENRSANETFSDGVARKIKEIYLSYQITDKLTKEKILELYLNLIGYGSNAYGIEQASQTFFGKSANNLSILESSILASLPKGPTYYSPYNNYDRLVGYPYMYVSGSQDEAYVRLATKASQEENIEIFTKLTELLSGLTAERFSESRLTLCGMNREYFKSHIIIDNNGCSLIAYSDLLQVLNAIQIPHNDKIIEYQTGRKDFILGRMLEDRYIIFDEYQEALLTSLGFEFQKYRENITYPHFVFYVREYLEEKYGKELLEKGGLRIYTSIDPRMQNKAMEIVAKQAEVNAQKFEVNNSALVTINNQTGEIVAMVGSKDYFNEEIEGNVNVITSELQPGSTFKSFVYSIAIDKEVIGTKTPIYDVETTFPGNYKPNNFDGNFLGKMNITTALNYSRNIPAVKMYYLAGGEDVIISWMEKLGVRTLTKFKENYKESTGKDYTYGSPLSLGTGLMTPLELAQAYSVYANLGVRHELAPIVKIVDSQGLVIEEFSYSANKGEQVIPESTAYITNYMLSDTSARPAYWNTFMSLSGRPAASKTGTSSMLYQQGNTKKQLPRNLWIAGYTPQFTTVVWSGNTDGSAPSQKANGLEASGPIWKEFMEYIHEEQLKLDWERPSDVKEVNISKITGMLSPEDMPENLIEASVFKNVPQNFASGIELHEVDLLCNGLITDKTPESAKEQIQVVFLQSLRPDDDAWEGPVQKWVQEGDIGEEFTSLGDFITKLPENTCERTGIASNIELGTSIQDKSFLLTGRNYVEIGYRSANPIQKIQVYLDDTKVNEFPIENKTQGILSGYIRVPRDFSGEAILRIEAIDIEYFASSKSYQVYAGIKDTTPPVITITNPERDTISLYKGESFNFRGTVYDQSNIRSINIYLNDSPVKIGLTSREFVQAISTQDLEGGSHTIRIEAIDWEFNTRSKTVTLQILER